MLVYRCIEIQLRAIISMYKPESTHSYSLYQKLTFRSLKCHNRLRPGATVIFKNSLIILVENLLLSPAYIRQHLRSRLLVKPIQFKKILAVFGGSVLTQTAKRQHKVISRENAKLTTQLAQVHPRLTGRRAEVATMSS